ncbi:glycosyltransferase family 4 protein [Flaviflexus equikiangi]|uniref:glycosyltransferase family 4 protein n=1 Tax=Flaviflexus equikiangi TaxID=2758573 RepID=UPI0015F63131|nr:glycosyltransferase family 4 protein [Flaviflexus equikiangi]
MRIAIVSRIFAPEPSAATFRLQALASRLHSDGHSVDVITASLPPGTAEIDVPYRIRRVPVLRDSSGYVRGYIPYMSFDIPAWALLSFGRSYDAVIVEPPPTTGFVTRLATTLRSTPYYYYCADVWADAAGQTGSPAIVVRAVRAMESFAWRGARHLLSVSEGVTERVRQLGITTPVTTIGNGIDITPFTAASRPCSGSEFIYAGTASEWHGAGIFLEALPSVHLSHPEATIRFIGGGSEIQDLRTLARNLGVEHAVTFEPVVPPNRLAPSIMSAAASLASVKPHAGYDFAFPTKMYSAAVCGTPLIYSGIGPGRAFVTQEVEGEPIGIGVDMVADEVASAMVACLDHPRSDASREAISSWARTRLSIDEVASRVAEIISR